MFTTFTPQTGYVPFLRHGFLMQPRLLPCRGELLRYYSQTTKTPWHGPSLMRTRRCLNLVYHHPQWRLAARTTLRLILHCCWPSSKISAIIYMMPRPCSNPEMLACCHHPTRRHLTSAGRGKQRLPSTRTTSPGREQARDPLGSILSPPLKTKSSSSLSLYLERLPVSGGNADETK